MSTTGVLRYSAFTTVPEGGNPAGLVLDAEGLSAADMQRIAAEVGYSECAFLTPAAGQPGSARGRARYFSPAGEVPFCGHATIALAVALAERDGAGPLLLDTNAGPVALRTTAERGSPYVATLTSVVPTVLAAGPADVAEALAALGWSADELDPALPPAVAYAGAHHLVLAAATRERLAALDYDFARLRQLCLGRDWVTVQLVWRESMLVHHARNPFPYGGVVEDPATGAAAAAYGAYLRHFRLLPEDAVFGIRQGDDMGRPSRLTVRLTPGVPEVQVSGAAVRLATPA